MSTITTNLGKVVITPKGSWSDSVTYEKLDLVTSASGGGYISLTDNNINHALSDTGWWQVVVNVDNAVQNANDAAILANEKAGLADTAATNANNKAGLADTAAINAGNAAAFINVVLYENVNLYNPNLDKVDKYIYTGGAENDYAAIRCTDFIDVSMFIHRTLVLSERPVETGTFPFICMYNSAKVYLGDILASADKTIFEITNPACKYIRFNTCWTSGVRNDNLYLKYFHPVSGVYESNPTFELAKKNNLTGNNLFDKRALIDGLSAIAYIELISYQQVVTMKLMDFATHALETLVFNFPSAGYNKIPVSEIATSFSKFYIGFNTGIYYDNTNLAPTLFEQAGVVTESLYHISYNVVTKSAAINTDFAIACLSDGVISGSYTLSTTINLPAGRKVIGVNCTVTLSAGAKIILLEGSSIDGITFVGGKSVPNYYTTPPITSADLTNYATLGDLANPFIFIDRGVGSYVSNCIFRNIDNHIITVYGDNYACANQGFVTNNSFINCKSCISITSEYVTITNNFIHNCLFGIIILSGNIYLADNRIFYSAAGVVLDDVSNGSHGSINGGCINHCSVVGLYIKNCISSEVICGINLFDAAILADYCEGLAITGSILDNYIVINGGKTNMITGSMFRSGWQHGNQRFTFPTGALSLKNNLIQAATDHSSVNN